MISDLNFPSYNILWRFSYKCFRYCKCSTGLGQSSCMVFLFPKISYWVFWSIYDSSSAFIFLQTPREAFFCCLSVFTLTWAPALLCLFLWDEYEKKKKTGSDFFFLTLCVTMRTTEYQLLLLLFLFSNFAKYLYSLDAWRIMYSQERDCIWNVFSNGKQRAKNPSRINNWIFTAKEKQGTLCLCLKWEAVFFHSLGNDSLQSTAREIRGHGLWNCYFSQLTVCRWHGL